MLRVAAFLFLILCEHPTLKAWPEFSDELQAVKAVRQNYHPTEEVLSLLEDFRCMVNDCIRIGLKENLTSMKSLSVKAYRQLSAYDVPTCYRLTAISRAAGILRNYRKELKKMGRSAKVPYVTRPSLTDCYGFRVVHRLVRLPIRNGEYAFIVLNDHILCTISGHTPRSLTLTANGLSISYSKEIAEIDPVGSIGIDRNLRQRHNCGLEWEHPTPRPQQGNGDKGQMQGDEESLQAKRRESQTCPLRKLRKDSAKQSRLDPPQRLRLDSQAGEGEEVRHRDGEHQRNPQTLPKGERTGQRIQI